MEIDETFTGHKLWKEGVKQHIIPGPGETREDAIAFMREALKKFKKDGRFTFIADRVTFENGEYIFTLHEICKSNALGLAKFGDFHPDYW